MDTKGEYLSGVDDVGNLFDVVTSSMYVGKTP